jgi:aerobic C4-dicarboxylate transport protein
VTVAIITHRGPDPAPARPRKKRLYQHLYFWVLVAIALGAGVGLAFPTQAAELKWLADLFVALVKMVIAPTIFCTVVVGIAGLGSLAKAGRLALRTISYFTVLTVVALIIGLVAINVFKPGEGLNIAVDSSAAKETIDAASSADGGGITGFILGLVPTSVVSAFTDGHLIQVLVVAILVAIAISFMGQRGQQVVRGLDTIGQVMFGVIKVIMYAAPIGAFGGMAFTVGKYGEKVLSSLAFLMGTFYLTCFLFVIVVLGTVARVAGFNIFKFIRFLKDELFIVLGTSSSETVLPRMLTKLEAAGAQKSVVGLTIPTGYSFNLDGTCIYLTMATLFLAQATNVDLSLAQQLGILGVLLLTSKGAAGVTGSGFIVLAATLASTGTIDVNAMAIILGIDRFMSEARALTNLISNGVATVAVAKMEGALDEERMHAELGRHVRPDAP